MVPGLCQVNTWGELERLARLSYVVSFEGGEGQTWQSKWLNWAATKTASQPASQHTTKQNCIGVSQKQGGIAVLSTRAGESHSMITGSLCHDPS